MQGDEPLRWLERRFKTPPMGAAARIEAGTRLRLIQRGRMQTERTPARVIALYRRRLKEYERG
jgi:hypothetical protein